MKATRLVTAILLALCFSAPLVAQPRSSSAPGSPLSLPLFDAPKGTFLEEARDSRFLFYVLTPEQTVGAPAAMEVRIDLNNRPYIEETLNLEKARLAGGAAVEILATQTDLRDRLYDLARSRANRLTFQILLDGVVVQEFSSFAELRRYNQRIKTRPFQPVALPSQVRDLSGSESPAPIDPAATSLAKVLLKDPACIDDCQLQYDDCTSYSGCNYSDCSECRVRFDYCVQYCPTVCTDPKSVTSTNKFQAVSVVPAGPSQCFEKPFENDYQWGEWYQSLQVTYKFYTLRRTEYCNGAVVNEELNVSYSTVYCYNSIGSACRYPASRAPNVCVF